MADYAIVTSPVDSQVDYANLSDHYTSVVGTSPGVISTDDGQILARAWTTAYWEILRCLFSWGVSVTDIGLWFGGEGRAVLQWLSAYYWLSDKSVSRDSAVFQNAERYKLDWEELCKNGGTLLKSNGEVIELDPEAAGAANHQARYTSREGTAAENNDRRFQSTPLQFLAGRASADAAGSKYGNRWDGGTR